LDATYGSIFIFLYVVSFSFLYLGLYLCLLDCCNKIFILAVQKPVMQLKRTSKYLVIIGTLVIWTIKFIIRPQYPLHWPGAFFLGIAPNLLGSFLIPFGACWFFSNKSFLVARFFKLDTTYDVKQVCCVGLALLIINEYLQRISFFGRTFDYYDILFSTIGLIVAHFAFARLQRKCQLQAR
jgi:hypothetical protein